MRIRHHSGSSSAALVFASMTLFVSPAHAQGPPPTGAESVAPQVEDSVVASCFGKSRSSKRV